ncbi:sugar ABC transporter ATP-binding protein [Herbiconiux sp. 11R-BC]|uniref:sugar ABC transporter ATP-binding protein n=1 Tax=Herbiconiux sp. 11R-BC TaxID=3111637 RepID=UPI003BFDA193
MTDVIPVSAGPRTVLSVRGLAKSFAGQRALKGVDLELVAGEVHALLGQNGCGKSTLIKCLAGFYEPDEGAELRIDGELVDLPYPPAKAAQLGLVFVHQDLGLVPTLSITENFALSQHYDTRGLAPIRWRALRARASAELAALGHADLDPRARVADLPVASQTIVAIARALSAAGAGARVLVLDEPTAALPDAEAARLFAAVRKVVERGVAVLYVTHKLDELGAFVDRATILRDGENVDTVRISDTDTGSLVRHIVGRDVETIVRSRDTAPAGDSVLTVDGLSGNRLENVGFRLRPGEIVGVAGMLGSGRSELARILFGEQAATAGRIELRGRVLGRHSPRRAVAAGIALIPEDRRREGGVLDMSVAENLTLTTIRRFWRGTRLSRGRERSRVRELIREYDVRPAAAGRKFRVLSGGNQQKVVIAKWLETDPALLVFDEPVQGVDVGARAEIFGMIAAAAENGAAVVLISSEIEQTIALSHRVLVLRNGRLVADWPTAGLTPQRVTQAMYFDDDAAAEPSPSRQEPPA